MTKNSPELEAAIDSFLVTLREATATAKRHLAIVKAANARRRIELDRLQRMLDA